VFKRPAGLPHPWGATSCRKAAPLTYLLGRGARVDLGLSVGAGKEGGGVLKSLGGGGRSSAPVATGVSAAEEAKKQVRASLAAAKAEKRSVRRQDNVKQERSEIAKMQAIKAEFNTTRFKRLAKEDLVKKLLMELESVGGEMEDDVSMLESLLPQRDTLETAAVTQEVVLAEESRKQQTYEHMQNRARNGAEDASKELDLLHLEVAALGRDLFNLEIYLRDTRRLRAKSEDALNWMQENYNFRVSESDT